MIWKITEKNFNKAVNRANVLNKKVHVDNRYAKKIILPLGSIIFAINIALLILGGFCYALEQGALSPEQAKFLNNMQFVTPYWRFIWDLFGAITDLAIWKSVMMIAFVFLLPVIVCNITTFVFSRCTKTETFTAEGAEKETATQLHKFVHEKIPVSVWDGIYAQEDNWLGITDLFVSAGFAVFFFCYWFSISTEYEMFKRIFLAVLATAILVVLFYYLYMALFRLLTLMIRRCYYHHSPWFRFACKVDDYYYKFYPEELAAKLERERSARRIYISDRVKETAYYKDKVNNYVNTYTGNNATSSSSSSASLSYEQKFDYINKNFDGEYSFSAIEHIENDPSLSPSEKDEMKTFLRAFGD